MREFIGAFSLFLEVQTTMVVEFYGVINALEEAQKMELTNVWLEYDSALVCPAFTATTGVLWMLRNRCNTYLIIVGELCLGLLIFFVKGISVPISWLI